MGASTSCPQHYQVLRTWQDKTHDWKDYAQLNAQYNPYIDFIGLRQGWYLPMSVSDLDELQEKSAD